MTIENERRVFTCAECEREYGVQPEACECGGTAFTEGAPSGRKQRKAQRRLLRQQEAAARTAAEAETVDVVEEEPTEDVVEESVAEEEVSEEPEEPEEQQEEVQEVQEEVDVSQLDDEIQTFLRSELKPFGLWDPEKDADADADEELVTIFDASDAKDARLAEASASQCGNCNRLGLGLRMSDGMIVCPDCGTERQGMIRDANGFEVPGQEKKKKAVGARVVRAKVESAAIARARVQCYECGAEIPKNYGLCTEHWIERNVRLYGQETVPPEKMEEHTKEAVEAFQSGNW